MVPATSRPMRSIRRNCAIRDCSISRSGTISGKIWQASASEISAMSRGSGMGSASARSMRALISCSAPSSSVVWRTAPNAHRNRSSRRSRMPRSTRLASACSRIVALSSVDSTRIQVCVSAVSVREAILARTVSSIGLPVGSSVMTTRASRSVSMRYAKARSIRIAPASAHSKACCRIGRNAPSSSPSSSRISSVNVSMRACATAFTNRVQSSALRPDNSLAWTAMACITWLPTQSHDGSPVSVSSNHAPPA